MPLKRDCPILNDPQDLKLEAVIVEGNPNITLKGLHAKALMLLVQHSAKWCDKELLLVQAAIAPSPHCPPDNSLIPLLPGPFAFKHVPFPTLLALAGLVP